MRFWLYDEEGKLLRKFYERHDAERMMQPGYKLITKPKEKEVKPTPETDGEARW